MTECSTIYLVFFNTTHFALALIPQKREGSVRSGFEGLKPLGPENKQVSYTDFAEWGQKHPQAQPANFYIRQ